MRLKLLSYNIQAGIASHGYRDYVTQSWRHVLPSPARRRNLDVIARGLAGYDFVGLQETDSGSLRSGFTNMTQYLAHHARFPWWHDQTNRRIGQFARHSIGFMSRLQPARITEHRLPGMIPGRGALKVEFDLEGSETLALLVVHLSLGHRSRARQLDAARALIAPATHAIVLGDLNCEPGEAGLDRLVGETGLSLATRGLATWPSWRPEQGIDHILVSRDIQVRKAHALPWRCSDHLPVAIEVDLPRCVRAPTSHLQPAPHAA